MGTKIEQKRQKEAIKRHISSLKKEVIVLDFNNGKLSAEINSSIRTRNKNVAVLKNIQNILKDKHDYNEMMSLYDYRREVEPVNIDTKELINEAFILGFVDKTKDKIFLENIKKILNNKEV